MPGVAGHARGVYIFLDGHLGHVNLEYVLALLDVGHGNDHLPVKAARPQQRGVKHVGPVRGG
jgi:hypothetical protein